jgi:hypothetical protein
MQEKIDTLDRALKDSNLSGEDATRMGGGADTLIREYLRISAIDSENTFKQAQARQKVDAAAANQVSDAASRTNIRQLVRTYMGGVIASQDNVSAMADAYTKQAISEGVFGSPELFGDDVLGTARMNAAKSIVADALSTMGGPMTRQEIRQQGAEKAFRAFFAPNKTMPMGDAMKRIMSEAESQFPQERAALRKQLEEQAAANRKKQLEAEAVRLREALQQRRDSMK